MEMIRSQATGDTQGAARAGFQVLAQYRGQQPHRLGHRLRQLRLVLEDAQRGVAVAGAGATSASRAAASSQSMTGLPGLV